MMGVRVQMILFVVIAAVAIIYFARKRSRK